MKLVNIGETQLIDFGEIVRWTIKTIRRNMPAAQINEDAVERCIGEIIDRTLTVNMKWTKVTDHPPEEEYLEMMGIVGYAQGWLFIQDIVDLAEALLKSYVDLPTHRIISMRVIGSFARIEMCEDFRVKDWTEKHAEEYEVRNGTKRW